MHKQWTDFVRYILDKLSEKKIRDLGYLPRWIIFAIDVFIVLISCIVTYGIVSSLNGKYNDSLNTPVRYLAVISVNAVFFLLFRTYAGIIRHSTFIDGVKLLVST